MLGYDGDGQVHEGEVEGLRLVLEGAVRNARGGGGGAMKLPTAAPRPRGRRPP